MSRPNTPPAFNSEIHIPDLSNTEFNPAPINTTMVGTLPERKFLICFDADNTLYKPNLHDTFDEFKGIPRGKATSAEVNQLVAEYATQYDFHGNPWDFFFKNKDETLGIMRQALQEGHHIAITSHMLYPQIMPYILERLGLQADEIEKIAIVCGFPMENDQVSLDAHRPFPGKGKNPHIAEARRRFGIAADISNTILIDDAQSNLDSAYNNNGRNPAGEAGITIKAPSYEAEMEGEKFYLETLKELLARGAQQEFIQEAWRTNQNITPPSTPSPQPSPSTIRRKREGISPAKPLFERMNIIDQSLW